MKTFLAQNQFLSSSVDGSPPSPTDTAAAPAPGKGDAAAEPIADPDGGYMGHRLSPALGTSVRSAVTEPWTVTADLIAEPSMIMEVPSEASAPAPTKNPDADALEATDHIHEIFFYVRKLMKRPPRFILDQARFLAEIEEVPLFVRDGDHLRRWSA